MTAPQPDPQNDTPTPISDRPAIPPSILITAVVFGLMCGAFEITNTSIGWHIASGRWMASNGEILDRDVFTFTSQGTPWVDHEWLFQILAATTYDLGGAPMLVVLRMVVVAALTLLLLRIGTTSGLDPPVALLLAAVCVWGARPRFFIRPELFTLLLVPLALWIFSTRRGRRWWPLPLVAVVALGANLHGGILVAPILIAAWFAGEIVGWLLHRDLDRDGLISGALGVAGAAVAPLFNPHSWHVWVVPYQLTKMVGKPHIPNPEWISPGPSDAPMLYLALIVVTVILALGSRTPQHWFTFGAATALALKHIRNLGLFFVLLPQTVAPALARWPLFSGNGSAGPARFQRTRTVACVALVGVLCVAALLRPWPRAGFTFADRWYPDRAHAFLRANNLDGPLYNDVRFGGWLILNHYPDHLVFLDDRNEIHEPLLKEIWEIFNRSDVGGWEALLDRWEIDTVLLRYHESIRVTTPDGTELGTRGFSRLWFRPEGWAMVYWDDVAMVLVRRSSVSEDLLAEREYHLVHPDDLEHVLAALRDEPALQAAANVELQRALLDDPQCRRAHHLAGFLHSLDQD